jgi:hypothetical protein
MRIDPQELRRHYASLPDGALEAINRDELSDIARPIFDEEVARRQLTETTQPETIEEEPLEIDEDLEIDEEPDPDWLEEAAVACSFTMRSSYGMSDIPTASHARAVLRSAGIPCHVIMNEVPPAPVNPTPQRYLQLMVPGALALHATSILDKNVFNEDQEEEWRTNFEVLSDAELRALNPDIFCAGLLDRVARLRRVYDQEMARRELQR